MDALGPKARALIDAGRRAYRPGAGDRARIESALRARLGADVLPPKAAVGSTWSMLGGSALGVCLGAGVAMWALSTAPAAPPTAATPSAYVAAPLPAPVVSAAPEAPRAQRVSTRPHRTAAALARTDSLSQEVALLARATREIAAGHAQRALSALSEHQQRFPHGKLTEERRAAKAQALCALGRIAQGRAEQAQLTPQSPAAARAKLACDAAEKR